MLEIISNETRKANKEHRCDWCNGKIEKGESYEITTLKNDDIYVWKNHIRCSVLYDKLNMKDNEWDEGTDADQFSENISEYINELSTEEQVKMISFYLNKDELNQQLINSENQRKMLADEVEELLKEHDSNQYLIIALEVKIRDLELELEQLKKKND